MSKKKPKISEQEIKKKKDENWNNYLRIKEKNIDKALERKDYAIKQFDTLMIALSTAGLGFISNYIKDDNGDLFWARASQIIFLMCLIANLLSHIFSMWTNSIGHRNMCREFEVDCYGEDHIEGFDQRMYDIEQYVAKKRVKYLNTTIRALNVSAFLFLITAISCFIHYTFIS